jgi:hypothetical protein
MNILCCRIRTDFSLEKKVEDPEEEGIDQASSSKRKKENFDEENYE